MPSRRLSSFLFALLAALPAAADPMHDFVPRLDAFVAAELERLGVPGATLALVHGQHHLLRGYGHANLETGDPVDPRASLFRIGSVSKVLTTVAVMQGVERGLLDLDADINRHLRAFQVPTPHGAPVTLRHLLTHTAGLDERLLGIAVPDVKSLRPLGAYLADRLPPIVAPPGGVVNYSNHGITLAAHLLEAASGSPFDDWFDSEVARPLGMRPGGFAQPLADPGRLAANYRVTPRGPVRDHLDGAASQVWPAGTYATTAEDMARFMHMLLRGGRVGDVEILQPDTFAEMTRRQVHHHAGLTRGRALGLGEYWHNGHRLLVHTGRVQHFTSMMILAPDADFALFISCNGSMGDGLRNSLRDFVAETFLPRRAPLILPDPRPLSPAELARFAGAYRQTRHSRHGLEKIAMVAAEVELIPTPEGRLEERRFGAAAPLTVWTPIGPDLFQNLPDDQPRRLSFRLDPAGRVTHALIERDDYLSLDAFARLSPLERTRAQALIALAGVALVISWPLRLVLRRLLRPDRPEANPLAVRLGLALALVHGAFAAGIAYAVLVVERETFVLGAPLPLQAVLCLPLLAVLLNLALLHTLLRGWRVPTYRRHGRVHLMLVSSGGWLLTAVAHYWNLLGPA